MKSIKTRKLEGVAIYESGFDIHFAIGKCSLGAILVAQSGRGICAILIGDDPSSWSTTFRNSSRR